MSHFLARSQSCIEHLLASTSTSLINSTLTIRGTNYITIYNQELSSNLEVFRDVGNSYNLFFVMMVGGLTRSL